ncbi:hypothetical protein Cpap_1760 [Ruminiclostridium papyrosolvens DSM 2782]|uniref:Trep_Strep domain-containing protein n=1 Tax=Ruminiclostridium papyrosolvens DSM 2782 TaxID=588581 RepID=F1TDC9_9FIRM|nr:MptD family putative ECF transporter S component [Ruminiclostridium papyrosolvens]EGD47567.1 hypothetical protein Cpap_1760 [Ruminiclostridium papyrosolvens DSM 2782]WES36487.1 MptD family putative ECF transporter S component [Ruminiclostridium papyrosolvens DSM 2782]
MDKKLNVKDLINIGIFSILYFIFFFICGMLGYIPVFVILLPLLLGIFNGIPFILFVTKTGKFGAITIMGTLEGLLCFFCGQSWISIVFGVVFGFLSDLIFKAENYNSWRNTVLGYCVFNLWIIGSMLPMWIMRDVFFEHSKSINSEEYLSAVMTLTSNWMLPVVVILSIVGAIIGANLGRKTLKKHFQRAGIV